MRQADHHHPIEVIGAKLRAMMPWSEEGKRKAEESGLRTESSSGQASVRGKAPSRA
jgi:hypothetical protein